MTRKRLVKVFRVRYEHAPSKTASEFIVIATSEIKALEEVLRLRHGFSTKDTLRDACTRFWCSVSASPWTGAMPTISCPVYPTGGAS